MTSKLSKPREQKRFGAKIPKSYSVIVSPDGSPLFPAWKRPSFLKLEDGTRRNLNGYKDEVPFAFNDEPYYGGQLQISVNGKRLNTFDYRVLVALHTMAVKNSIDKASEAMASRGIDYDSNWSTAISKRGGLVFKCSYAEICEIMGKANESYTRKEIAASLYRMFRFSIQITSIHDGSRKEDISLIERYFWIDKKTGEKVDANERYTTNSIIQIELSKYVSNILRGNVIGKPKPIDRYSLSYAHELREFKCDGTDSLHYYLSSCISQGSKKDIRYETLCPYVWGKDSKRPIHKQVQILKREILPDLVNSEISAWSYHEDKDNPEKVWISRAPGSGKK